jgi:hypothetical protein
MTYTPSESEKQTCAVIQSMAVILFFIPPLVARRRHDCISSPYIRYWTKVCFAWSIMSSLGIAASLAASIYFDVQGLAVVLLVVHVVFCLTGAVSSHFNTPFRYWFVAGRFCHDELADVYGQLISERTLSDEP